MRGKQQASRRATRSCAVPLALGLLGSLLAGTAGMSLTAASAATARVARPANLYASPAGHGSACSHSRPCAAATAVKAAAKDFRFFGKRVVVHLARGTYYTTLNADFLPPSGAKNITITGAARGRTIVDAGGRGPVLTVGVDTPPVTVAGLELRHGAAPTSTGIGGGILDGGGDVTLIDSTITGSRARQGGGIGDAGGKVTVRFSTISGNTASTTGGGISDTGGGVTVIASTISGNTVTNGLGGGIYENDARLQVRAATITANAALGSGAAAGSGGGIALDAASGPVSADIVGATLSANRATIAGGAIWAHGSATRIGANILSADRAAAGAECSGSSFTDIGYNLADDGSCNFGGLSRIATAAAIALHPLARNGGPTPTMRISAASVARGLVPVGARISGTLFCAGSDQRGVPRRQGPARRCDTGAYQFEPPVISGISPASAAPGSTVTLRGHGFAFVTIRFGQTRARARARHGFTRLSVRVPPHRPGTVTITMTNADGTASRHFRIL
jgi:IPT/TIG domain-containing protein